MRKLVIDKTPPKVINPEKLRESVVILLSNGVDSFAKLSSLCENISDILEAGKMNPPENERLSALSRELTDYLRKYDSFGKSHKNLFPSQDKTHFVNTAIRSDKDLSLLLEKLSVHFSVETTQSEEITDIQKTTSKSIKD